MAVADLPRRQRRAGAAGGRRRRRQRRRRHADRIRRAGERALLRLRRALRRGRPARPRRRELRLRRARPGGRRRAVVAGTIPPQGFRARDDATYYPVPWLLSSRGYGVLVDATRRSRFHLAQRPAGAWSAEVAVARASPARLRRARTRRRCCARFTAATGRQPPPVRAVAVRAVVPDRPAEHRPARRRGAIWRSCARPTRRCRRPRRSCATCPAGWTAATRPTRPAREVLPRPRAGDPHLRQPGICASYQPLLRRRRSPPARCRRMRPARPASSTRSSAARARRASRSSRSRSSTSPRRARPRLRRLLSEVLAAGHDGWMEDFGEYTPPDANVGRGTAPSVNHNGYPTRLPLRGVAHARAGAAPSCASSARAGPARRAARRTSGAATRRRLRLRRAAARRSSRRSASGMSGVSRWGSDIGGYDTIARRPAADARAAAALDRVRRRLGRDAHEAVRASRSRPTTRPQIFDPAIIGRLAPLREAAHAALSVPARRRRRLPRDRHAAHARPRVRSTRDAAPTTMSSASAPTCSPRRWSRRGRPRAPCGCRRALVDGLALPVLGRRVDRQARARALRGGAHRARARGAGRAAAVRARGRAAAAAAGGRQLALPPQPVRHAAPAGVPARRSQARIFDSERVRSRLTGHDWTLTFSQAQRRTVQVEAVLPWRACGSGVTHAQRRRAPDAARIRSGQIHDKRAAP